MKMRQLMILLSVLTITMLAKAQDPHFSQFFSSPLTLNPAYTGKFDGKYRLAINYKNQWHPINYAFTTSTISADLPLLTNYLPLYDTWGIGIIGLSEQTANKAFTNSYLGIST
ncbi:MAG: type IX secretion system membrane protein PorP/SprF, partial [Chitinophagaceae bacterium]